MRNKDELMQWKRDLMNANIDPYSKLALAMIAQAVKDIGGARGIDELFAWLASFGALEKYLEHLVTGMHPQHQQMFMEILEKRIAAAGGDA